MDHIEKQLVYIENETNSNIDRIKSKVHETSVKLAKKVIASFNDINYNTQKYFPSFEQVEPKDVFNPGHVFEVDSGKIKQEIKEWNKNTGILPDRKVLSYYHVYDAYNLYNGEECIFRRSSGGNFNGNFYYNECRTNLTTNNKGISTDYDMIEYNRTLYLHNYRIRFEVDNYLNLYDPFNGVYLMFNKIPFPDLVFYVNNIFSGYCDKDCKRIFSPNICTGINIINGNGTEGDIRQTYKNFHSVDYRNDLINTINNNIIPKDYYEIQELFKGFREMFSSFTETTEKEQQIDSETNEYDPKDKVINSQEKKINELIKKQEGSSDIVKRLNDEYDRLKQEYNCLQKEINRMKKQKYAEKEDANLSLQEDNEKLRAEIFFTKSGTFGKKRF